MAKLQVLTGEKIQKGDIIKVNGVNAQVVKVYYQSHFNDEGYRVEFVDTKENYRSWVQYRDGGDAVRMMDSMTLFEAVEILGAKSKYTMAHVNKLMTASLMADRGTLSLETAISLTMQVAEECGGAIAKTLTLELAKIKKAQAEFEQEVERVADEVIAQEVAQEIAQVAEPVVDAKTSRAYRKIAIKLSDALFEERVKSANGKFKAESVKSSIKDICVLVHCLKTGNYEPVYKTDMYINHGNEYCHFLLLAEELNIA